MCGLCGIVRLHGDAPPLDEGVLVRMRDSFTPRGPDDAGTYVDEWAGLGSRRLAILDLSPRGHMPMRSQDERYAIAYNGEVYNFRELRAPLEAAGVSFRSGTDTEVLLELYRHEGPAMLGRLNGMFAFAIWDRVERKLFAARDRLGIKPLYYAIHDSRFFLASEEKGLFAAGVPAALDPEAWEELLLFRYVSGTRTPFRGVHRLGAGEWLELSAADGRLVTQRWWSLAERVGDAAEREAPTPAEAAARYRELLDDAVALRRISDVPVGVLLSGGLDSSAVAASLAKQAGSGVASFTVRFAEKEYDEWPWAKAVADHWGLDAHQLTVPRDDLPGLVEEATWLLDEPLVHANDVFLLAISRYAKPRVTVLLSGEGADETLGGYVRYRLFRHPALLGLAQPLAALAAPRLAPEGRLYKAASILAYGRAAERVAMSSAEVFPAQVPFARHETPATMRFRLGVCDEAARMFRDPVRQVMHYEQHTYLQSILDRNDRMTMGASIECRVPFLDYRIVEWLPRLRTSLFFSDGPKGKAILRDATRERLPPDVIAHKKWGFAMPWHRYFREIPAFRRWVEGLPGCELARLVELDENVVRGLTNAYLGGNDRLTPIVRQLAFVALWYEVCVKQHRGVLV